MVLDSGGSESLDYLKPSYVSRPALWLLFREEVDAVRRVPKEIKSQTRTIRSVKCYYFNCIRCNNIQRTLAITTMFVTKILL